MVGSALRALASLEPGCAYHSSTPRGSLATGAAGPVFSDVTAATLSATGSDSLGGAGGSGGKLLLPPGVSDDFFSSTAFAGLVFAQVAGDLATSAHGLIAFMIETHA